MIDNLPPWQQRLSRSLHVSRSKPASKFVQLATVNALNKPQNRTIVYRGRNESGTKLWFITDKRSEKFAAITVNPHVELCWYFESSREQYRFSGSASFESGNTDAVKQAWNGLSNKAKQQFCWGEPKTKMGEGEILTINQAITKTVPAHFCLLWVNVLAVDYLNLTVNDKDEPQQREVYTLTKTGWHCQSVVP